MSKLAVIPHRPNQIITTQAENVRRYGVHFDKRALDAREALQACARARLLAGAALVAIKQECAHGEFEQVCLREFPTTPERTLQNWKTRAEHDLRNKELREATKAVLENTEDETAQANFEQVANHYFVERPTLQNQLAGEIKLLGYRKPAEPSGPRAKLPRGKNAEIARREFETKSKLCFGTLVREVEKAATLKLGDARCWDVETTDEELESLDRALVLLRAGLKTSLEKRKTLRKKTRDH